MTRDELNDPLWRLEHLYQIQDKNGDVVVFRMNVEQRKLYDALALRNLILKARQLGFSTLIQLLMLDQCIFVPHTKAGVIAQDDDAASKIFRDKIKFAWDRMPEWIHQSVHTTGDSTRELEFDNGSSIRVATSMRSTTLQYLHVSEFGKICAKYPAKATEVLTGSLPALGEHGFCFIESTAEGRTGKFFEMCELAQKPFKRGPKDFQFFFSAWHDSPDYVQDFDEVLSADDAKYFADLHSCLGRELTRRQINWYVATLRTVFSYNRQMMMQEYPSLPTEAFNQSQEGCWFVKQFTDLHNDKRITSVPWTRGYPVHTAWDIGRHDGTAIWCFQHVGLDYRFIRYIEGWNQEYDYYVAELTKHGYVFGTHYLPHDAAHLRQAKNKEQSKSAERILQELGLTHTKIVPSTERKILSINAARSILPSCWFDGQNCAAGILHLESYHKVWNSSTAAWTDEPAHDVHSEGADAFQQFATGYKVVEKIAPPSATSYQMTNPFLHNR